MKSASSQLKAAPAASEHHKREKKKKQNNIFLFFCQFFKVIIWKKIIFDGKIKKIKRKKLVKNYNFYMFFGEFPTMSGSIKNFLGHDIDLKHKSHKFMQKYAKQWWVIYVSIEVAYVNNELKRPWAIKKAACT